MVFPISDDNSDRLSTPFVNYALIVLNVVVFVVLQRMGADYKFTYAFSTVPEEIVTGKDLVTPSHRERDPVSREVIEAPGLQPTPISVYLTLLTSMFMHGGWMHLAGNMLFLWIFGDNVEDELGHARYAVFYLLCGLLASLAHVGTTYMLGNNPRIPSLGASGAISGVLGGYMILHPHRRVTVFLLRFLTQVPAWVAIGMWFAFQILSSLGSIGNTGGGVAYGAHIGGFVAGLVLVRFFALGVDRPPASIGPAAWPPR
jgi:membrane associated rhomboid family serine protease